jgi:hypothetical protein
MLKKSLIIKIKKTWCAVGIISKTNSATEAEIGRIPGL